jgi:hypothetical protein
MSDERDRARQLLTEQVLDATTREEVRAAREALSAWIAQYPEEREWMRDGFEQLAQMEEVAEAQAAEKHSALQPEPVK